MKSEVGMAVPKKQSNKSSRDNQHMLGIYMHVYMYIVHIIVHPYVYICFFSIYNNIIMFPRELL